jgi:hypothetical protein
VSVLLAAVTATVTTPVPTPSPLVVHDYITKIVQVQATLSPELLKGLTVLLLFLSGVGASIFHQVIEAVFGGKDGFSKGVNTFLSFLFGVVVAGLYIIVQGGITQINWDLITRFATALLVALGSSQGRWAFKKWVDSLGSDNPVPVDQNGIDEEVVQPIKTAGV